VRSGDVCGCTVSEELTGHTAQGDASSKLNSRILMRCCQNSQGDDTLGEATGKRETSKWEKLRIPAVPETWLKGNKLTYLSHTKSAWQDKRSYPRNRPWRPIGLWDVKDPTLSRQSAALSVSESESELLYNWRSVSQYVLVSSPIWDFWPEILFSFFWKVTVLSYLGRPLWREVGSVICQSAVSLQ
jgi:hypothetical protein